MKTYSDAELNLPSRSFTGQQWADGTAQRVYRDDFNKAVAVKRREETIGNPDQSPDWGGKCDVCGASPTVPATGMCGPCTFGDSSTVGGNW